MSEDARFEDGAERPLRLRAAAPEDVPVLSALLQDAVLKAGDISWLKRRRRFAMLVNRFRWEDAARPARAARPFERVRALLTFDGVTRARTSGVDPRDRDLVLSILSLDFTPGADGAGTMRMVLAGDGEIALDLECLEVMLSDVTRPHLARGRPAHPET